MVQNFDWSCTKAYKTQIDNFLWILIFSEIGVYYQYRVYLSTYWVGPLLYKWFYLIIENDSHKICTPTCHIKSIIWLAIDVSCNSIPNIPNKNIILTIYFKISYSLVQCNNIMYDKKNKGNYKKINNCLPYLLNKINWKYVIGFQVHFMISFLTVLIHTEKYYFLYKWQQLFGIDILNIPKNNNSYCKKWESIHVWIKIWNSEYKLKIGLPFPALQFPSTSRKLVLKITMTRIKKHLVTWIVNFPLILWWVNTVIFSRVR